VGGGTKIPAVAAPLNWNSHGALHALARHAVPTIAVAERPRDEVTWSRHARHKVWFDRRDSEDFWRALTELGRCSDTPLVVFWGDDDTAVQASERRDELPETLRFVLPPRDVVKRLVDKTTVYTWAAEAGIRVAETIVVRGADDWERALETAPVPCVVKPAYRTQRWDAEVRQKVFLVQTRDELRTLRSSLPEIVDSYVLQQWIPGPATSLFFHLAYYDRGGRYVAGFTGRKRRQWPVETGTCSAAVPWEDDEVDAEARRILEAAGLRGLGAVELKRNEQDGELWLIEPTCGRPNGQSEMASPNGVDLLHIAYCDAAGLELPPLGTRPATPVSFFTLGPDVRAGLELRRRGQLTWRQFVGSYRGPRLVIPWDPHNPVPFLLLVFEFVRSLIRART
jgi:predicted ATP-grasp superfamily ATP-dependent carboligase